MCAATSHLSAHRRRYAQISSCGANILDQSGLSSKENEYMCDGTSQAQPGYWLSRQVPPRSSFFSRITKLWWPACFRRIAMQRPENPDPMMTIPGLLLARLMLVSP